MSRLLEALKELGKKLTGEANIQGDTVEDVIDFITAHLPEDAENQGE